MKGRKMELLNKIQQELKAPKGQKNNFGNYMYRSCEDILEAVKPLLGDAVLTLTDEVVCVGTKNYVKATACLMERNEIIFSVSAFAREAETKKGMDDAQITGSASSYARKYALNGLFCIDDTKDADTQDNRVKKPAKKPEDELPDALKENPEPKDKASIQKKFKELPEMSAIEKAIMINVCMKCANLLPKDLNKRDFNKQMAIDTHSQLGKFPADDKEEQVTIELINKMYGGKK
jgi:hypothetical protein